MYCITINFVLPKCIKLHHFQVFLKFFSGGEPLYNKTKIFMQHNMSCTVTGTRGPKLKLPQGPIILSAALFMSLYVPAGACIPVASASPIHVFPIQHVLKHCGVHKHSLYNTPT